MILNYYFNLNFETLAEYGLESIHKMTWFQQLFIQRVYVDVCLLQLALEDVSSM